MPPQDTAQNIRPNSFKKYFRWIFPIVVVSILVLLAAFLYTRYAANDEVEPQRVALTTFTKPLILSLSTSVTDAAGIPFSGMVRFDSQTQTYSNIANTDEGIIQPLGSGAFNESGQYLAMRNTASSSDLVIYDPITLATKRVVTSIESGSLVGTALWSQNAEKFAYFLIGTTGANLLVENTDGTNQTILASNYPIGFSPDASKLLVRGVPELRMIDIATKEIVPTTGTAFVDMESNFELSRSGEYLVAYTEKQIDWYTVDWNTYQIIHQGSIPTSAEFTEVLFTFDNTLVVRTSGSDLMFVYEYKAGEGVVQKSISSVQLPAGADIFKVVTW